MEHAEPAQAVPETPRRYGVAGTIIDALIVGAVVELQLEGKTTDAVAVHQRVVERRVRVSGAFITRALERLITEGKIEVVA